MGKETLSVNQANSIINEINDITKETRNKIEISSEQFLTDISHVWEDENAVKFSGQFRDSMIQVIDNLSENNNKFCSTVKDIADAYVKTGNIGKTVTSIASKIAIQVNSNLVKDHFVDGENSDEFGFVNPETGPEQVMDAFDGLKTNLKSIISDTNNRIKSINAFGNNQVKLALASSAAGMIGIVEKQIIKTGKICKDLVQETARRYSEVGSNAVSGASIDGGGSSGGSGSGGSSESMPVVKYGPPTPTDPITPDPMPVVKYGPPTPSEPITPEPMPVVKYGPPTPSEPVTPDPMPVVKYGPPTPSEPVRPDPMPIVKYGPPTPSEPIPIVKYGPPTPKK